MKILEIDNKYQVNFENQQEYSRFNSFFYINNWEKDKEKSVWQINKNDPQLSRKIKPFFDLVSSVPSLSHLIPKFEKYSYELKSDIPIPNLISKTNKRIDYKDYQKDGISMAIKGFKTHGGAYLAWEPGLGKTIGTAGIINSLPTLFSKKIIIWCPKQVRYNWYNELKTWLVNTNATIQVCGAEEGLRLWADIIILNYDMHLKNMASLQRYDYSLAIIDEMHNLGNSEAKRTKNLTSIRADYVLGLSGTPITSNLKQLYPQLKYIFRKDPTELLSSPYNFGRIFCGANCYSSGHKLNMFYPKGEENSENKELLLKFLDSLPFSSMSKKMIKDLPTKTRTITSIKSGPYEKTELWKKLKGVEEDLKSIKVKISSLNAQLRTTQDPIRKEILEKSLSSNKNALLGKQQILKGKYPLFKLELFSKIIKRRVEKHKKVIVFTHHHNITDYAENLMEMSGIKCLRYNGETKNKEETLSQFENEDYQVMFTAISGVTGINLQHITNYSMFLEWDWSPFTLMQCEDRIWRIGQELPVEIEYLKMENSIEEQIINSLFKKLSDWRYIVGEGNESLESFKDSLS